MRIRVAICLVAILLALSAATGALADVPDSINYQGILLDSGGDPVTTTVSVSFTIYDDPTSGVALWSETQPVTPDAEGRFNVLLGNVVPLNETVFDEPDRYLELQVAGDPPMTPRAPLVTVAYSYRVATVDGSTGGVISGDVDIQSDLDVNGTVEMDGFRMPTSAVNGHVLTSDGSGVGTWQPGGGSGSYWNLTGNAGTTPGTNFLGTTDNNALELKVNNARVFRLEPGGASPNLIGGYNGNSVTANVIGAVIGGGGFSSYTNEVTDDYGAIGGGYNNQAGDNGGTTSDAGGATVGGGYNNTAGAIRATISGGQDNNITASGIMATIGGGDENIADNTLVTISGGGSNTADGYASSVGGGLSNAATNEYSTVAGGRLNATYNSYTFIGGGLGNEAWGQYSVVGGGGGSTDTNRAVGNYSAILGGHGNDASGNASMVGGGAKNRARGEYSVVCGGGGSLLGDSNCAYGPYSFVGGGSENTAGDYYATVGGGTGNFAEADRSTIAGGYDNSTTGGYSAIGGGRLNIASGSGSTVPGGFGNAARGQYSLAAGMKAKANHSGSIVLAASYSALSSDTISSGGSQQMVLRADGGLYLANAAGGAPYNTARPINTWTGAYLSSGGTWTNFSDKNSKENFAALDGAAILEKVAQLPITRWNYKEEGENVKHVGPMAQDFYALFGVGSDDKSVSTIDPAGIALAAIQELYKKMKEIEKLKAEMAEMKADLQELQAARR